MRAIWVPFFRGIHDSLSFPYCIHISLKYPKIFKLWSKCLLLNGIFLFAGLYVVEAHAVPLLERLFMQGMAWLACSSEDRGLSLSASKNSSMLMTTTTRGVGWMVHALFSCLWLWPMLILSLMINGLWYAQITDFLMGTFKKDDGNEASSREAASKGSQDGPRSSSSSSLSRRASQVVYRTLLIICLSLQLSIIPWLMELLLHGLQLIFTSKTLVFLTPLFNLLWLVNSSCVYAYFCFEYKWTKMGMSIDRQMVLLESNSMYFTGFGFVYVLTTSFLPLIYSLSLYATLFPLFLIIAISCVDPGQPKEEESFKGKDMDIDMDVHLPIFLPSKTLIAYLVHFLAASQEAHPI